MAEDRDQQDFRTLGDRYRARLRLRSEVLLNGMLFERARPIITDDDFHSSFLKGEDGNALPAKMDQ